MFTITDRRRKIPGETEPVGTCPPFIPFASEYSRFISLELPSNPAVVAVEVVMSQMSIELDKKTGMSNTTLLGHQYWRSGVDTPTDDSRAAWPGQAVKLGSVGIPVVHHVRYWFLKDPQGPSSQENLCSKEYTVVGHAQYANDEPASLVWNTVLADALKIVISGNDGFVSLGQDRYMWFREEPLSAYLTRFSSPIYGSVNPGSAAVLTQWNTPLTLPLPTIGKTLTRNPFMYDFTGLLSQLTVGGPLGYSLTSLATGALVGMTRVGDGFTLLAFIQPTLSGMTSNSQCTVGFHSMANMGTYTTMNFKPYLPVDPISATVPTLSSAIKLEEALEQWQANMTTVGMFDNYVVAKAGPAQWGPAGDFGGQLIFMRVTDTNSAIGRSTPQIYSVTRLVANSATNNSHAVYISQNTLLFTPMITGAGVAANFIRISDNRLASQNGTAFTDGPADQAAINSSTPTVTQL